MGSRKRMTEMARRFRRESNIPEQRAWQTLRTLRKHGYPVRRQHPVEGFLVDFAILRAKLAIEIDGGIHRLPEVAARDMARQKRLEDAGWTVLRLPAETAMSEDHLMAAVQNALERSSTNHPRKNK